LGDHSTSLVAMAAITVVAVDPNNRIPFVQELCVAQIPSGKWRYYDGMLYMLAMLQVRGNFKIYVQG
jgi:oligosaccharide reducing-end xylanase